MLKAYKNGKRAAFIPFIVAGDPSIERSEALASALIEEGADLLELGVPFSDAMADGPVIQAASERASKVMPAISQVIELAGRLHRKHPRVALILFTYYNPVLRMGIPAFAEKAAQAGVFGVLTVDLPPEEATVYRKSLQEHGLKTIFLASPTTSPERVSLVDEASTGFIYYVSRTGVTGVQSELSGSLEGEIARMRELTRKTLAVGFGISTPEQARVVAGLGDAVVVGSAFVRLIARHSDSAEAEKAVRTLARELVAAIR